MRRAWLVGSVLFLWVCAAAYAVTSGGEHPRIVEPRVVDVNRVTAMDGGPTYTSLIMEFGVVLDDCTSYVKTTEADVSSHLDGTSIFVTKTRRIPRTENCTDQAKLQRVQSQFTLGSRNQFILNGQRFALVGNAEQNSWTVREVYGGGGRGVQSRGIASMDEREYWKAKIVSDSPDAVQVLAYKRGGMATISFFVELDRCEEFLGFLKERKNMFTAIKVRYRSGDYCRIGQRSREVQREIGPIFPGEAIWLNAMRYTLTNDHRLMAIYNKSPQQ